MMLHDGTWWREDMWNRINTVYTINFEASLLSTMRLKFAGCPWLAHLIFHGVYGLMPRKSRDVARPRPTQLPLPVILQTQQIAEESPWEPKSKGLGRLGIRDKKNRQSWLRGGSHPMDLRLDFPKAELRCSSRIGVSDFEPKRVGKKTFGLDGPAQEELFRRWSWCWILISISYTVFYSSSDFWISNCAWWFLEACLKHVARFGPTGLARSTLQVAFPDTSQWPLDLPELPIVSYLQWNHTHHYSNWPGKPIPTIPKYHFAPTWVEIRWQQNQPNNLKHE